MNKKNLIMLVMAVAILVIGAGCETQVTDIASTAVGPAVVNNGNFVPPATTTFYSNPEYGFSLYADVNCDGWYKVVEQKDSSAGQVVDVYVPQSKLWPTNTPWISFNVSKDASSKAEGYTEKLKNGYYLVQLGSKDQPGDLPNQCIFNTKVEQLAPAIITNGKYENAEYGFSLVFPDTWKGYTVTGSKGASDEWGYREEASFEFNLNNVKLITVKAYTKAEFAILEKAKPNGVPFTYNYKIAENDSYVFTAYGSQDVETSEYPESADVYGILKTFKTTTTPIVNTDPLGYNISGDIMGLVSVSTMTAPFDYTAKQLKGMADECGSTYDAVHFDGVVSQFSSATKTIYNFKYTGASQDSNNFVVTLLPNPGYQALEEFKQDFDVCAAGGDAYPTLMNKDWLLFVNACGTGFDDGSGRPHGCDEVARVVIPTLKLN